MTWDEHRTVIEWIVRRVEVPEMAGSRIRLRVTWYDLETTEFSVWMGKSSSRYTYAERVLIEDLLRAGASREALEAALPARS